MDDTQRLDAIDEHGLCIASQDTLTNAGWTRAWVCHYCDRMAVAPTIREALDAAVLDMVTDDQLPN